MHFVCKVLKLAVSVSFCCKQCVVGCFGDNVMQLSRVCAFVKYSKEFGHIDFFSIELMC